MDVGRASIFELGALKIEVVQGVGLVPEEAAGEVGGVSGRHKSESSIISYARWS